MNWNEERSQSSRPEGRRPIVLVQSPPAVRRFSRRLSTALDAACALHQAVSGPGARRAVCLRCTEAQNDAFESGAVATSRPRSRAARELDGKRMP